jgi:hypothetical protein
MDGETLGAVFCFLTFFLSYIIYILIIYAMILSKRKKKFKRTSVIQYRKEIK